MKEITSQIAYVSLNYQFERPPAWLAWLEDQVSELLRFLAFLLNSFSAHLTLPHDSRPASYLVIGLFWLLLFSLIALLIRQYQRRLSAGGLAGYAAAADNSRPLSFSYWLADADSKSAKGEFGQAFGSLYFSLLCYLHEKGLVAFSPAKTNREYQAMLSGNAELEAAFARIVFVQEKSFFGGEAVPEATYRKCRALCRQIEEKDNGAEGG